MILFFNSFPAKQNCSISLQTRILLMCLLFFSMSSYGFSAEHNLNPKSVTISAIINEQTHAIAKCVLKETYNRIGYEIEFNDLPGQRALEWADNGITHGDVARILGTQKKFTNLVPIKIPVIHFKGASFTKIVTKQVSQWEDLKEFRLGVIRGIRYSTIGTQGMDPFFAMNVTNNSLTQIVAFDVPIVFYI